MVKQLIFLFLLSVINGMLDAQVILDDDFSAGMDGWSYTETCNCGYVVHLTETDPEVGQAPPSLTWQKANICDCECLEGVWCDGGQQCTGCAGCAGYEGQYFKTVQLPNATTSFTLSFDWRASSNLDWSTVTNSAMHIDDGNGTTFYQEDLVMGGTYDTGWQEFEQTFELEECGQYQEITIYFDVRDVWWDTPWCNKNWWDNVLLIVEQIDITEGTAGSNSPVCVGEVLQFTAAEGETYTWSGPNGFNSMEQNPFIDNVDESHAGEYYVNIELDNGCDTTLTLQVEVSEAYTESQQIDLCDGQQWLLQDGTAVTADTNITEVVNVVGGCDSIFNINLDFHPMYTILEDTIICPDSELTDFYGEPITADGVYEYTYQSEMGCDSIVELTVAIEEFQSDTLYHTICPGETVEMLNGEVITDGGVYSEAIESPGLCGGSLVHVVNVSPPPVVGFSVAPETGDVYNAEATFYNESIGDSSLMWDFYEYGTSFLQNPTINFSTEPGEYAFCLYVWTEAGCADSLCAHYSVLEDFSYYVPNVFTPNGDGVNDLFYVVGTGIDEEKFNLQVFNRWGQMVFESRKPLQKWDGRNMSNSHYVSDGVYVYRLLIGGVSTPDQIEEVGHVTVFR